MLLPSCAQLLGPSALTARLCPAGAEGLPGTLPRARVGPTLGAAGRGSRCSPVPSLGQSTGLRLSTELPDGDLRQRS